ncbi:MAG TPA: ATP-binding cassette domain-containing protein [Victivallales bacterium]|nr:ATP-binding cassette domain-containing protein [Victivallales bacterium]HRR28282.1 ATP-binding cassette domain-containing protein [Victivallales bacterium]HRU00946.1 ATP-binding cassette domain-containing protein [Victivallales bacterium]
MISFKSVFKTLSGKEVLKNISFEVNRGDIHTILGPTGSGKSVILKHIIRLLEADNGLITYDGKDISNFSGVELEKYRADFGYLFQSGALIAWLTVGENVALPLIEKTKMSISQINKRVSDVLNLVELTGCEDKMPDELSGGMLKRAALARAIINNPKVILLDEPTSGLDPIMSRKIDNLIKRLHSISDITIVMVTHDLISAFSVSDRITMITDGAIRFHGTVKDFCESRDEYVMEFIKSQTPRHMDNTINKEQ